MERDAWPAALADADEASRVLELCVGMATEALAAGDLWSMEHELTEAAAAARIAADTLDRMLFAVMIAIDLEDAR